MKIKTFDKKVLDRITIDIDYYKSVPRTLLKAIDIFGYNNVKLYLSSSGTGFRLEIKGKFSPLENLYYRAILEDDPYRLRYSIVRYFSTDNPDLLDISFYYKVSFGRYSNTIREIPIRELVTDELLERYRENPEDIEVYNEILNKLNDYLLELYLWIVVIPADKKYVEILAEKERKFKLLRDPYFDDRLIFYQVSSDDVVERLQSYGIPVLHYRQKIIKSKKIFYDEFE